MWWFDHDDDNEDEMMPNHKQKVGWWMHILENCLRKETYILLVIQKQNVVQNEPLAVFHHLRFLFVFVLIKTCSFVDSDYLFLHFIIHS